MKRIFAFILILLVVALSTVVWLSRASRNHAGGELMVYCAAGLKKPVEEIAAAYERETGAVVRLQYGGTGSLLSAIRVVKRGDLFIAADGANLEDARKFGVIRDVVPLVRQRPVVAVRAGNPRKISTLDDLLRKDVRLALANPETAAIGRSVRAALGGGYVRLAEKAVVFKPTVTEITADVGLGAVDAAVVWDSTVPQFAGTEAVDLPELSGITEAASAAVLTHSTQPANALRFANYLAAPGKGGAIFEKHGFLSVTSELGLADMVRKRVVGGVPTADILSSPFQGNASHSGRRLRANTAE